MRGWLPRSSPPLLPSRSIRRLGRLVRYSRGQLVQQWESLQACPLQPRLDRCRAPGTIAVRTHRDRHVRWCGVHGAGEFLTGPTGQTGCRPRCSMAWRVDRCHVLAHGWVRQAGDHPGPGGRGGATHLRHRRSRMGTGDLRVARAFLDELSARPSASSTRSPAAPSPRCGSGSPGTYSTLRGWELSRCQASGPARSWSPGSASRSWRTPWARFGRSSCGTILTDVDA